VPAEEFYMQGAAAERKRQVGAKTLRVFSLEPAKDPFWLNKNFTFASRIIFAAARGCVEKAYAERFGWLFYVKTDPGFDFLRTNPKLNDLMRRIVPVAHTAGGSAAAG
jgi:hypothetical protein